MRPKLGTVFSQIIEPDLSELEVEHIALSRERRSVNITFPFEVDEALSERITEKIKDLYRLNRVNISCIIEDAQDESDNLSVDYPIYGKTNQTENNETDKNQESYTPKERVIISDMLYGRSIRDFITPLKDVNEEIKSLTVRGQIFSLETKDIKSKKNDKEYHLISMDITDFTDSISAQLFINKTEDDEPYKKLMAGLKKGIFVALKGKAQYSDYKKEIVISAYSVAQIESFKKTRKDNAPKKRVELQNMH